jgi:hypothetical protein
MSGEMTCQHALQGLSKVFEQMETICRLRGCWNRFSGGGGIVSASISTHQLNFRVRGHPGG